MTSSVHWSLAGYTLLGNNKSSQFLPFWAETSFQEAVGQVEPASSTTESRLIKAGSAATTITIPTVY